MDFFSPSQELTSTINRTMVDSLYRLTGADYSTGQVRYLLSDGLGSVRHVTDEAGAVVAYYEFDPYGNTFISRWVRA